jgi:Fe-S-cluster containining protein
MGETDCLKCGTCCAAPDISTLKKPVGVKCSHLDGSLRCGIYETRPAVCRDYRPDELCREIAAPTLGERVDRYRALFGL